MRSSSTLSGLFARYYDYYGYLYLRSSALSPMKEWDSCPSHLVDLMFSDFSMIWQAIIETGAPKPNLETKLEYPDAKQSVNWVGKS